MKPSAIVIVPAFLLRAACQSRAFLSLDELIASLVSAARQYRDDGAYEWKP